MHCLEIFIPRAPSIYITMSHRIFLYPLALCCFHIKLHLLLTPISFFFGQVLQVNSNNFIILHHLISAMASESRDIALRSLSEAVTSSSSHSSSTPSSFSSSSEAHYVRLLQNYILRLGRSRLRCPRPHHVFILLTTQRVLYIFHVQIPTNGRRTSFSS